MNKDHYSAAIFLCKLVFFFLILWIVLMIITASGIDPHWSKMEFIKYLNDPGIFFYLNYLNATLFTIIIVGIWGLLFLILKEYNSVLSYLGMLFIPIYGVLNMIAYVSQVSILPMLLKEYNAMDSSGTMDFLILQLAQSNTHGIITFLNNFAYAILGIPSILYGIIMIGINGYGLRAGILLILNAVFCFAGIYGIIVSHPVLSMGSVIGGVFYVFSLIYTWKMLRMMREVN